MKTRAAALAVLLILGACSKGSGGGPGSASGGAGGAAANLNASLEPEMDKWRTEIVASNPLCQQTSADQKCKSFNVECKAQRDLKAGDAAQGITTRVVAAMTFNGWDPKLKQSQDGTATAEFIKGTAGWTRQEHPPVNLSTCADM